MLVHVLTQCIFFIARRRQSLCSLGIVLLHVYSPRERGILPEENKLLTETKSFATSIIYYKFQQLILKKKMGNDFSTFPHTNVLWNKFDRAVKRSRVIQGLMLINLVDFDPRCYIPGFKAFGCASDWWSEGCGFDPRVGNILSWILIMKYFLVILSLTLIQAGQFSVSDERMFTLLVPVKVWLRKLTELDMSPLGCLVRKTSTQTNIRLSLFRGKGF